MPPGRYMAPPNGAPGDSLGAGGVKVPAPLVGTHGGAVNAQRRHPRGGGRGQVRGPPKIFPAKDRGFPGDSFRLAVQIRGSTIFRWRGAIFFIQRDQNPTLKPTVHILASRLSTLVLVVSLASPLMT